MLNMILFIRPPSFLVCVLFDNSVLLLISRWTHFKGFGIGKLLTKNRRKSDMRKGIFPIMLCRCQL